MPHHFEHGSDIPRSDLLAACATIRMNDTINDQLASSSRNQLSITQITWSNQITPHEWIITAPHDDQLLLPHFCCFKT